MYAYCVEYVLETCNLLHINKSEIDSVRIIVKILWALFVVDTYNIML